MQFSIIGLCTPILFFIFDKCSLKIRGLIARWFSAANWLHYWWWRTPFMWSGIHCPCLCRLSPINTRSLDKPCLQVAMSTRPQVFCQIDLKSYCAIFPNIDILIDKPLLCSKAASVDNPFKWRHFQPEIILLTVRWYLPRSLHFLVLPPYVLVA